MKLSVEERFNLFVRQFDEMSRLRHFQQGGKVGLNISWNGDTNHFSHQVNINDEEDFRSFLIGFRKFISVREPVFVRNIVNECIRRSTDDFVRTELRKAKEDLDSVLDREGGLPLTVNGKLVTGNYSLDLWINGKYFHTDREKQRKLEAAEQSELGSLFRAHFLFTLTRVTDIVNFISGQIGHGLENNLFDLREDL